MYACCWFCVHKPEIRISFCCLLIPYTTTHYFYVWSVEGIKGIIIGSVQSSLQDLILDSDDNSISPPPPTIKILAITHTYTHNAHVLYTMKSLIWSLFQFHSSRWQVENRKRYLKRLKEFYLTKSNFKGTKSDFNVNFSLFKFIWWWPLLK